jgi:RND superfamily putative drug exporter
VLNVLSMTATFGALVYVFQEGNLRWLVGGFTPTGATDLLAPALIFCLGFGLSMDYEIFLLSRITEEYRRRGDTAMAVAHGLDRSGPLLTSTALILAVVIGALATSGIVLLKQVGFGLALAAIVDATVIRGVLAPAIITLAGPANWWSPRLLRSPVSVPVKHPVRPEAAARAGARMMAADAGSVVARNASSWPQSGRSPGSRWRSAPTE